MNWFCLFYSSSAEVKGNTSTALLCLYCRLQIKLLSISYHVTVHDHSLLCTNGQPAALVILVQVDMTKLVGVNLASSHTYQDSSGVSYSMGTSLLSGPKYHIISTPAAPTRKVQDGETTMYLFLLIYSFSVSPWFSPQFVCVILHTHVYILSFFFSVVISFVYLCTCGVFSNHFSDWLCGINGRLTGRNFIGSGQGLIWHIIQEVFWRDWGKAWKTSVDVVVCRYRYEPGTLQLQRMTTSYLIVSLSNFLF